MVVFVRSSDAMDDGAFFGVAGNDRVFARFENLVCFLFNVEAKASFAMIFVGAMALIAVFGKDRADVAVVLNGAGGRREDRQECGGEKQDGAT